MSQLLKPQAVMNHHAKSFAWAARFLAPSTRRDAALLYAFARTADDYADEENLGSADYRMQRLASLRESALIAMSTLAVHSPAPQLADEENLAYQTGCMLRHHGVSADIVQTFLAALSADSGPRTMATEQELLLFAYGVAGTVGQMMRPLLQASPQADAYAIALGVAMQLTNIARDVVEDGQRGRCYIPAQWGVSATALQSPCRASEQKQAFAVIQRLLMMADTFYAYAQSGLQAIPLPNRRAIGIASALYQGIGHKILRMGAHRYWDGRVSLSAVEKIMLILRWMNKPAAKAMPPGRDVWLHDLSHLAGTPGFPG
jgi:15-cis-phytoene synthase